MKTLTVQPADDGKRLDRWMKTNVPGLSLGLTQKYLRLKRVKVDGKPARGEDRLRAGACVNLYIEDEFFEPREKPDALLSRFRWKLTVVYEDENILLADKQPGLICHPDENEKVNTLLTHVRAYLYQKGFRGANGFQPVLVNRIDRFTGGLVICAKTEEAMHILNAKIRSHELTKLYLAAVHGAMRPADGTLDSYILKDAARSRVSVLHKEAPGAQRAVTHYRTLTGAVLLAGALSAGNGTHAPDPRSYGGAGASPAGRPAVWRGAGRARERTGAVCLWPALRLRNGCGHPERSERAHLSREARAVCRRAVPRVPLSAITRLRVIRLARSFLSLQMVRFDIFMPALAICARTGYNVSRRI